MLPQLAKDIDFKLWLHFNLCVGTLVSGCQIPFWVSLLRLQFLFRVMVELWQPIESAQLIYKACNRTQVSFSAIFLSLTWTVRFHTGHAYLPTEKQSRPESGVPEMKHSRSLTLGASASCYGTWPFLNYGTRGFYVSIQARVTPK